MSCDQCGGAEDLVEVLGPRANTMRCADCRSANMDDCCADCGRCYSNGYELTEHGRCFSCLLYVCGDCGGQAELSHGKCGHFECGVCGRPVDVYEPLCDTCYDRNRKRRVMLLVIVHGLRHRRRSRLPPELWRMIYRKIFADDTEIDDS